MDRHCEDGKDGGVIDTAAPFSQKVALIFILLAISGTRRLSGKGRKLCLIDIGPAGKMSSQTSPEGAKGEEVITA